MGGPAPAVAPHRRSGGTQWPGPAAAAAVYLLAALALTWPLVTRLTTAIPWDLGDPLLNSWIVAWGADHLWRFVSGDLNALSAFWHANIFHPSPYALAYSEHLLAQAVQVLPVWALTNNPVLCYNLLFVSTFAPGISLISFEAASQLGARSIALKRFTSLSASPTGRSTMVMRVPCTLSASVSNARSCITLEWL